MRSETAKITISTGRRKTSVARARVIKGGGKVMINGRPLGIYLPIATLQQHAIKPLIDTETTNKFDVAVSVHGGGKAGQAGAIRHAIARALLETSPDLKPILREKGFLTRDSRMKERKKYGQPGARKRFQFSKR